MRKLVYGAAVAAWVLGLASSAQASLITFDFNALGDDNSNTKVQTYMNNVLDGSGAVQVTGSKAEKNYDGDDHVVGPTVGSHVKSHTLGTGDGGIYRGEPLDAFIINSGTDRITMLFSMPIYAVSFDYATPYNVCGGLQDNGSWCGPSRRRQGSPA